VTSGLARFAALIAGRPWTFAKTMPENPHEYTLRKEWADDPAFDEAVRLIRSLGYRHYFGGHPYLQLDLDGHTYWTMGWPVAQTILINRKPLPARPDAIGR
jgi:hypothetical protein